jgi:hypothetical protein
VANDFILLIVGTVIATVSVGAIAFHAFNPQISQRLMRWLYLFAVRYALLEFVRPSAASLGFDKSWKWLLSSILAVVALSVGTVGRTQESLQVHSTGSERTAQLVGVQSELNQLRKLADSDIHGDGWQVLWLHQRVSERVMGASLQVDATIAQIDNEISRANELRGYLSDRRDRRVSRANLLSALVGGGLGATSSGLQLSSSLNKPAAIVGISAGTLSAGLAISGIHAQKGETSQFNFDSNMLAELFDRPTLPDSHYPPTVWTFLNEAAPNSSDGLTRKQQLLRSWVQVKRIDSLTSVDKIDHLTSEPSEAFRLSIDDLEDRVAMLQDVRARISFLKRDLGELLTSLPGAEPFPPSE